MCDDTGNTTTAQQQSNMGYHHISHGTPLGHINQTNPSESNRAPTKQLDNKFVKSRSSSAAFSCLIFASVELMEACRRAVVRSSNRLHVVEPVQYKACCLDRSDGDGNDGGAVALDCKSAWEEYCNGLGGTLLLAGGGGGHGRESFAAGPDGSGERLENASSNKSSKSSLFNPSPVSR
jgi:hypothetical protein